MTCTGSLAIKEVVDNFRYSIIFNKNINYCKEIIESFNVLNDGMVSRWSIDEDDSNLIINIFHV